MDKQEFKKIAEEYLQKFMALDIKDKGRVIAIALVVVVGSCSLLTDSDSHKIKILAQEARPVLCNLEKLSAQYIELAQVNPMMEAQKDLEVDGVMAKLQHSDKVGANADVTKLIDKQNKAKFEYEKISIQVKEIINEQGDKSEQEKLKKVYERLIASPCQD